MVILSVSVVTKKGKILMARQYVPMSRLRIEGLLAAFPKLVFSEDNSSSKQHTFVETDEVRYIYQPMDMLYLLLITNMQSNILEDLATLRTIAKLIPDYCQGHDETAVEERAFDLIFAVDEVVSPLGYREQVNYKQIEDYTKMDSAEAKLTEIIEISKMENAKQLAKEKEKQFDAKRKRELQLQQRPGLQGRLGSLGVDLSSLGGIAGGSGSSASHTHGGGISSDSINFNSNIGEANITQHHSDGNKYNQNDSSSDNDGYSNRSKSKYGSSSSSKSKKSKKNKSSGQRGVGFKLGSMKKSKDKLLDEQLNADKTLIETNLLNTSLLSGNAGLHGHGGSNDIEDDNGSNIPVEVNILEKLNVSLDRDGVIQKFDIKGDMEVIINQPEAGLSMFEIVKPNKVKGFGKISYRPHPRMDTSAFKKNILMLKDASKVFKMGRNAKTSILKWRMSCNDEDMIPIRLNFWPESSGGEVTVSVTYTIEKEDTQLNNVIVTLPTPTNEQPDVTQCDGQYTFYQRENELQWNLGDLKTGDEGQFDYTLEDVELDDLWPVSIHFEMPTTYLQIEVSKVSSRESEEEFEFAAKHICNADKYIVGDS